MAASATAAGTKIRVHTFHALFILKLILEINYILASFKPTDDVCLSLSKMSAFKELLTGFPEETLSYIWDKIIRNS